MKGRDDREYVRAAAEMKMEGKHPRGRLTLSWKDTARGDVKAWKIREEWATDRENRKGLGKTCYHADFRVFYDNYIIIMKSVD